MSDELLSPTILWSQRTYILYSYACILIGVESYVACAYVRSWVRQPWAISFTCFPLSGYRRTSWYTCVYILHSYVHSRVTNDQRHCLSKQVTSLSKKVVWAFSQCACVPHSRLSRISDASIYSSKGMYVSGLQCSKGRGRDGKQECGRGSVYVRMFVCTYVYLVLLSCDCARVHTVWMQSNVFVSATVICLF